MRRFAPFLWLAGAGLGVVAELLRFGWRDPLHWIPDLAVGWSLIGCGLVAGARSPRNRIGMLIVATGFSWFLPNFADVGVGAVAWVGVHSQYLYRGLLVHLVVAYPAGRVVSRPARALVVVGYATAVATPVVSNEASTLVLAALLVAVTGRDFSRTVGRSRGARRLAFRAASGLALALAGHAIARLAAPTGRLDVLSLVVYEAALSALAVGLLAGLVSASLDRAEVTDLVVELGESRSGTLRHALARALGDPSLEVGYWLVDSAQFVDAEGRVLTLPEPGSRRSVTLIERDHERVGVLVHEPAVLDDPALVQAVSSAAQLAAANARLQAEVRAQVAQVSASRRRILEAGDEARQRLESRLHNGTERQLAGLAEMLSEARQCAAADETAQQIGVAQGQLGRALEELRELAVGLHPRILSERGLGGALASLAERCPVSVEISVVDARLPGDVEAAAYFVCSEALANVAKYAGASRAMVSVVTGDGRVRVVVADDGVGGADPSKGSGLRGLADRVETLGGVFGVTSVAGRGTRIVAEVPLGGDERQFGHVGRSVDLGPHLG